MENCPFCSVDVKQVQEVFEGKYCSIYYCLTPSVLGNLLLIPKQHYTRLEDLSPEIWIELHRLIQMSSQVYENVYGLSQYLILQKNGKDAGQTVSHIHMHIMPMTEDGVPQLKRAFHHRQTISSQELTQRVKELRKEFALLSSE